MEDTMNTLYNSLLGQAGQSTAYPGSAYQLSVDQTKWALQYAQQSAPQYSQAQMLAVQQGLSQHQHRYQIDGVSMDLKQFVETLCPDPDDPWRSHLLLKYAGRDA